MWYFIEVLRLLALVGGHTYYVVLIHYYELMNYCLSARILDGDSC